MSILKRMKVSGNLYWIMFWFLMVAFDVYLIINRETTVSFVLKTVFDVVMFAIQLYSWDYQRRNK